MKNSIKTELWKSIHNNMFTLSLAIGLVICLMDVIQNHEAVLRLTKEINLFSQTYKISLDCEGFSLFIRWIAVNGYTFGNQLFYFIWPILAAMPFGWSYYYDKKEGVYNQIIIRSNVNHYFLSKYIATFVSGGLTVSIPVLINLLLNALICPYYIPQVTSSINSIFNGWFLSSLYYTTPWAYALIWCVMEFLWGGCIACLCFVLGTKARNRVIVILTPFAFLVTIEAIFSALSAIWRCSVELSPLQLARAATTSPNPAWVQIAILGTLTISTFSIGYWQVRRNESV